MDYEDMAVLDNFSEDEITFALNRQLLKEKYDRVTLTRVRKIQSRLKELKGWTNESMHAFCDNIFDIDDRGKKLVFKHFSAEEANHLEKELKRTKSKLTSIADFFEVQQAETFNKTPGNDYNT